MTPSSSYRKVHVQLGADGQTRPAGWSPSWIGKPGKGGQAIIDAIGDLCNVICCARP